MNDELIESVVKNLAMIASAITPLDASSMHTPEGNHIESLTEAIIYVAQGLHKIADSIDTLAISIEGNDLTNQVSSLVDAVNELKVKDDELY